MSEQLELVQSDGWTKPPLDMLSHAHRHLVEATESSNRYALLGFDQSVEGSIAAFLRYGPGVADESPLAAPARAIKSNFWKKVNYLDARLKALGRRLAVPLEEVTRVHEIRNDLQHDGGWIVPSGVDTEISRLGAVAVFEAVAGMNVGKRFAPLQRMDFEFAPADNGASEDGNDWQLSRHPTEVRVIRQQRRVAPFLYELARANDPDREGMHVTRVERLAQALGGASFTRISVASALNNAHDLFDRVAPAVYAWKPSTERAIDHGVTGRALADVAFAWCRENDPARAGMHYNRDIKVGLERWGVVIRGQDKGRTIRQALARDARFIGDRGVFRWQG